MSYIIQRIEGVVGGFITFDADIFDVKIFEPGLAALKVDMKLHADHKGVGYIFHPAHDIGVAAPLNEIATMGWKCRECTSDKRLDGWTPDGKTWLPSEPGTFTQQVNSSNQK